MAFTTTKLLPQFLITEPVELSAARALCDESKFVWFQSIHKRRVTGARPRVPSSRGF